MPKKLKVKNSYFILTLVILISCLVIYADFIFGNKFFMFEDIGSDTKSQYVMWYSSIADKIRTGTFSFWDFKNGFGANISMEGIYDPFQFLICIFGAVFGTSFIPYFLIYVNILKIVLAGLFMYYFLSCFKLSEKSKIILSYMYAFNGFMIVWGQHYAFATVVVYLPILFATVEKLLSNKKMWILVTLATFVIGIYSLYFCYMSLLTVGIYYVIRLIQINTSKIEKFKIFVRETLAIILGLGLSCFSLMPVAYLVLNVSPRTTGDASLWSKLFSSFTLFPSDYYRMLFYRMFSSNLQGSINYTGYINYYEALNFCCSNLLVLLLLQYVFFIFKKSLPKKEKAIQFVIMLLLALAFLLPTVGLVYNGFCYSMHRWSFVVIPILIVLSAKALNEIIASRNFSVVGVILYFSLMLIAYWKAYKNFSTHDETILKLNTVILFLTGLLIILGLYLFVKGKFSSQSLFVFLLSMTCINLVTDSYVSANYRGTVKKNSTYISDVYNEDVKNAVNHLKQNNPTFFRMEKTFISSPFVMMDPLAQNYYGINTYNSIINKNTLKFNEAIWGNIQIGPFSYQCFSNAKQDHLQASLINLKYILSNSDEKINGFTKCKDFGGIIVLKNNYDVELGRLYTKSLTEQQFEETEFNIDNLLADVVILEKENKLTMSKPDLEVYKGKKISETLLNNFKNQELAEFKVVRNDSHLIGKINASQNGTLFLSVPFEEGWKIYVDGNRADKLKANYGFTAIDISAGQHDIKLDFIPPLLKEGTLVSIFSLLVLVILVTYKKFRKEIVI